MSVTELVDLMKTGGPYTALAVMMWVSRYLYLAREEDKKSHDIEKQALNERIIKVVEGQNAALATSIENQHLQNTSLTSALDNQRLLLDAIRSTRPVGG